MAYEFGGDNLLACQDMATQLFNMLLDENGNFLSCNVNTNKEFDSTYLGVGKNDCYYFREYEITRNSITATNKYTVGVTFYRTPFAINDEIIRPYFTTKRDFSNIGCPLVLGLQSRHNNWIFDTNRYGDKTNNIDKSKFDNTNYVTLYSIMTQKYGNPATMRISNKGKGKADKISPYYDNNLQFYYLDSVLENYTPNIHPYFVNPDDEHEDYKTETNIPIFFEDDIEGIKNWVLNGDRSNEIIPPSPTKTDFRLWIKGLDAPTYKLNWHNEALENEGYDFSNSTIYIRAGKQYSDGIHHHPFKEVDYSDGSIKFTWYDIDEVADTNFLFPWINLEVYASYIDDSGEENKSKFCSVDLRKKAPYFSSMYQNVVNGSDGSNITIVNYDDDPEGYDDDDDDYHDPSDNEDDTPDDSTDISVSGEVCKTFKIEQIELKKLSQFLWSNSFFDNILLVNNSPIENIISLKALIGTVATTGSSQTLTLGNVTTTANAIPCNESIVINVGSITLPRKYNNFLDFEPYTKVQIYLPFYGCAMLDSSLVIGRTISIKYIIDVITATAKIKIIHDNKTLYEFKTTCGSDLPITSSNRASVEMGYLSSGVGMGVSIASGNVLGGLASALSMAQSQYHSSTSGNVSGVLNFHDSRMITVLVDRPVYTELRNFNKTHGRVCNLSKTLRDLRGFTKCAENVQIPFNCLDEERTMIIEQLTNGVII